MFIFETQCANLTNIKLVYITTKKRLWHRFSSMILEKLQKFYNEKMKHLIKYTFLLASIALLSFKVGDIDDIKNHLGAGNSEKISSYFSTSVQMSLPGSKGLYSKSQAKLVLQKFFTQNKAKSASIVHKGASGGGANYVIYKLETSNGSFRVQIFMKSTESGKIHEIKIKRS